jgi:glutaredoxin
MQLAKLGRRVLTKSKGKLGAALNAAKSWSGELRDLLETPAYPEPKPSPAPVGSSKSPLELPRLGNPEQPAQVYGRTSCPWTGRALSLLEREGVECEFVDLRKPESSTLHSWLLAETKQNTQPYVFLRGRFIGGYNALDEIVRLGQLHDHVMSASDRAKQASPIRIEVMPRSDQNRPPPGETT